MSPGSANDGRLPPDREALVQTTLALSVDERVAWREAMIIALESGALPKRVPDQLSGASATTGERAAAGGGGAVAISHVPVLSAPCDTEA